MLKLVVSLTARMLGMMFSTQCGTNALHICFMTPCTDVCALCEVMRQSVQAALTEEEKLSRTTGFQ